MKIANLLLLLIIMAGFAVSCSDTRIPVGGAHPVGKEWLSSRNANYHGNQYLADKNQCTICHDAKVFCFGCHFGPEGSKVPPGSDWTHQKGAHTAGALMEVQLTCVTCHALTGSFGYGPASVTCGGCHDGVFPMHAASYFDFHMANAKNNLVFCQQCHGAGGTNFSGGVTTVACVGCHTSARAHPTDWQGSGTVSHRTAGNINTVCTVCHDVMPDRTAPLPQSPSCYSASFTNRNGQNRACHPGGFAPHEMPFGSPALHGVEAKKDFLFCQNCHGSPGTPDFTGGSSGIACASCHSQAKAHPTDWQGLGAYSHRTSGNMALACSICHDYTNGRTPPVASTPSCYSASFTNANGQTRSCHSGGPGIAHVTGQPWLDRKNVQFHGSSSLTCSDCHVVSSFCSQCHFGPSGSRIPPGSGWSHGRSSHDNFENYSGRNACINCHNINRTYGNMGNCHNCH